jgi:hypothetical protein
MSKEGPFDGLSPQAASALRGGLAVRGTHARPMLKHCTCKPEVTSANACCHQMTALADRICQQSHTSWHQVEGHSGGITLWGAPPSSALRPLL